MYYKQEKAEYTNRLKEMSDPTLLMETEKKIFLSLNRRDDAFSDYHWQIGLLRDEWESRNKLDQYKQAYNKVTGSDTKSEGD